jgi:hypothetical protein
MGLVWDYYPRGGGELLTALALADHADHAGANVRPGMKGLARKTRQSVRTVQIHVARMRANRWLQTVRYPQGGHGRATEYRINPIWISNPAESAPSIAVDKSPQRVQLATARVQSTTSKGAVDDREGCKAFAPQPSGTVIEPSTTTRAVAAGDGVTEVVVTEYRFPEVLQGKAARSARELLALCPPECRQPILDEIAGIVRRGALRRSSLGLLKKLVQCAADGTFVPSRGTDNSGQRHPSRAEAATAAIRDGSDQGPRSSSQVARAALAAIREKLESDRSS